MAHMPLVPFLPSLRGCQVQKLELQEVDYQRLNALEGVYDWLPLLDEWTIFLDDAGEKTRCV